MVKVRCIIIKDFYVTEVKFNSKLYPKSLQNIPNPPKKLYIQGNLELLNYPVISIVGSRSCSENGKNLTRKFAYELSQCGITIASGLAKGIDTVAHLYSYKEKGKTIAVLPSGFNHIFPKENVGLYEKILDNGGLVISEYSPHIEAKSQYFLERNRIVSGLSLGVLVVEAAHRSGTSVTAKLAKSQGRKVFALPHEIWDSHGVGTNRLIKTGATLVTCVEDILDELYSSENLNSSNLNFSFSNSSIVDSSIDFEYNDLYSMLPTIDRYNINAYIETLQDDKSFNNHMNASNSLKPLKSSSLLNKKTLKNTKHQFIYDLISDTPISINEICKKTNESISVVSNSLFLLELEGYIKKVAGGYVCILDK